MLLTDEVASLIQACNDTERTCCQLPNYYMHIALELQANPPAGYVGWGRGCLLCTSILFSKFAFALCPGS